MIRFDFPREVLFGLVLCALTASGTAAQDPVPSEEELAQGKVHYVASCARCHGVNGGGGEGPALARQVLPRAPDDASLMGLAAGGIPGTAMTGSWWLSETELTQVARYVRSLAPAGPADAATLAGDPVAGASLFEDANCTRCHTLNGFGTSRGPDLTTLGLRRGADFIRQAIVDPGAALPRGMTEIPPGFVDYLVVRVVDGEGNEIRGARMNEDSYTIQIRDGRGTLHSFYKPGLRTLEKQFDRSLMRSYRDRFTDQELDDLVAYLASLGQPAQGVS